MKIIDALWEKRNLGVDTIEVTVEECDSLEATCSALNNISAHYAVVRIPVAKIDYYSILHKYGFVFAEALIKVNYNVKQITYNSEVVQRLSKSLEFRETSNFDSIFKNIQQGMFTTDRVYLDPFFSDEQAANRYVCWMKDELERGSEFYEFFHKNQPIGFICLREIDRGTYYPMLGGLYPQGKPAPYGVALLYRQLDVVASKGGTFLTTNISMNNLPVLRAYSQCGYTFSDAHYVFIRHK